MDAPTVPLTTTRIRFWSTLVLLGFGSGLPLVLTDSTLKLWMQDAGISIKTIGFFALAQLPYNLKFLWAPLLDRYAPPFLGRRRGWLLITQVLLAVVLGVMAFGDPKGHLALLAALGVGVAFLSASQDIATDAWRTESLSKQDQGIGTTTHIAAYRLGILAASAGALLLADRLGWRGAYLVMAGLMLLAPVGTLMAREPQIQAPRSLRAAVVEPFRQFLSRKGALLALLFFVFYKLGDQLAVSLMPNFLREIGFTKTAIGTTTKGVGLPCLIIGGYVGGWLMRRWTLRKALFVFGCLQVFGVLVLLVPAYVGPRLPALALVIGLENLAFGTGVAAWITLLMRLCDLRYTGTQYSLLSSLAVLPRTLIAAPAGHVAVALGWEGYFVFCGVAALPGLLLLGIYRHWGPEEQEVQP